jgi:tetratricopeptide (TPR) repeat protein
MQNQQPFPRALVTRAGVCPGSELYSVGAHARICRPVRGLDLVLRAVFAIAIACAASARPGGARAQARPGSAVAAPPAAQDTASAVQAAARVHFDAAMEHYKARRYREAIREFEQSAAYVPNAELWFDVGRAHEQLGEYGLAIENYRRYLRDRVDAPDADELARHIDTLAQRGQQRGAQPHGEPSLRGALAVDATQPGALVLLDGKKLGLSPIDRVLDVEPGSHRIDASRAGYVPFRAQVDVQEGALSAAYVAMQPFTRVHDDTHHVSTATWVAAGASAAALITAGALRVAAQDQREDGDIGGMDDMLLLSNVALAGALTFAVSAALAYMLQDRSSSGAETHSSHLSARADRLTLLKQR